MFSKVIRLFIPAIAALVLAAPAWAQNAPLAAQACLSCHGANGAGQGGVPGLADHPELAALFAWRDRLIAGLNLG